VFPIVGVQTVEHVHAIPDALRLELSNAEIAQIQDAAEFDPGFPMSFLFSYSGEAKYNLRLTAENVSQVKMATWIQAPPKPLVSVSSLMTKQRRNANVWTVALSTIRGSERIERGA
jgi:hypothetical protein